MDDAFVGIPLCVWAISDCGIRVIESLQNCLLRPCARPGVAVADDGKLLMHKSVINSMGFFGSSKKMRTGTINLVDIEGVDTVDEVRDR